MLSDNKGTRDNVAKFLFVQLINAMNRVSLPPTTFKHHSFIFETNVNTHLHKSIKTAIQLTRNETLLAPVSTSYFIGTVVNGLLLLFSDI